MIFWGGVVYGSSLKCLHNFNRVFEHHGQVRLGMVCYFFFPLLVQNYFGVKKHFGLIE